MKWLGSGAAEWTIPLQAARAALKKSPLCLRKQNKTLQIENWHNKKTGSSQPIT